MNGQRLLLAAVFSVLTGFSSVSGAAEACAPLLNFSAKTLDGRETLVDVLDRVLAAEAVVRTLIGHGAIGALSTHDLALTEIAQDATLHGSNVHMCSRSDDQVLDFDYHVKPGVNGTDSVPFTPKSSELLVVS